MKLAGWIAYWTDGDEFSILGVWSNDDEARAACQQDVRDGEDMSTGSDPSPLAEDERWTLTWTTNNLEVISTAPCDNGQGQYVVNMV